MMWNARRTSKGVRAPRASFFATTGQIWWREPCICVLGVGFVGASLLREFGKFFDCIGFDVSIERLATISKEFFDLPRVTLTSSERELARGTHFLIAVPTALRDDYSVNLDCVVHALASVLESAQPGSTIVIESSVPVGTTRRLLGPCKDLFYCGMSPERIDPGRSDPRATAIPKLVSGLSRVALKQIVAIYSRAFDTLVEVSKPEVAEMTKLYENCFRMVNIAYVNEVSDACQAHGIDPLEMVRAAATKPFGFMPFYPGLGVGGHCIPVNPYYLFDNNKPMPLLEHATACTLERPSRLAHQFYRRCRASLAQHASYEPHLSQDSHEPRLQPHADNESDSEPPKTRLQRGPRILVVGIGFKAGQADISGAPALTFARALDDLGCQRLAYFDPLVPASAAPWMERLEGCGWNDRYLDEHFDGLAVCNRSPQIDLNILLGLKRTCVQSYAS